MSEKVLLADGKSAELGVSVWDEFLGKHTVRELGHSPNNKPVIAMDAAHRWYHATLFASSPLHWHKKNLKDAKEAVDRAIKHESRMQAALNNHKATV